MTYMSDEALLLTLQRGSRKANSLASTLRTIRPASDRAIHSNSNNATLEFGSLKRAIEEYSVDRHSEVLARATRLRGQVEWAQTFLAVSVRRQVGTFAVKCLGRYGAHIHSVVDLGCGCGSVLRLILSLAPRHIIDQLRHVTLIDQNEEAVAHALMRIRELIGLKCPVIGIVGRFDHASAWRDIKSQNSLFVANCSLHELPAASKQTVLEYIKVRHGQLLLTELEGNHDSLKAGSGELIHGAAKFYDALIRDAYQSLENPVTRRRVIGDFLLAELSDIWFRDYNARENYQMTAGQWSELVTATKLRVKSRYRLQIQRGSPALLGIYAACVE